MVSLATAKHHLGVTETEDDEDITRLISSVTSYLSSIGVTVDPEPGPVTEAILIFVQELYQHRIEEKYGMRQSQIEGIGARTYFDPKTIHETNALLINILVAPYLEISL